MSRGLTGQRLIAWWLTVEQRLTVDGELTVTEDPDDPGYRRFDLEAPGYDLAIEARFRYEEWYAVERDRWQLTAYVYHYADRVRGGDIGYHWHPMASVDPSGRPVHHLSCRGRGDVETAHFRWYPMLLLEAHEALYHRYAAGEPIDCRGLHPLDVTVLAGL